MKLQHNNNWGTRKNTNWNFHHEPKS